MSVEYIQRPVAGEIETIDDSFPDDFFITCASFEDRCKSSVAKLADSYRCNSALVFRYSGFHKKSGTLVEEHLEFLKSHLEARCTDPGHLQLIRCIREDPLDGFIKFQDPLEVLNKPLEGKRVTIDISAFTKEYIMVLFKLINVKKNKVRVFHTRVDYRKAQKRHLPLSWGVKSIISIPFHNGSHLSSYETVLIAQLGYEGHRSYAVWQSCEPLRTIALIGHSEVDPYEPGRETRAEKANKLLLSVGEPLVEKRYLPIYNLNANLKVLREIYADDAFYEKNLCLTPLGSKVQALAASLFIQGLTNSERELHVLSARPFFYTHEYPKPPLETWEYVLF